MTRQDDRPALRAIAFGQTARPEKPSAMGVSAAVRALKWDGPARRAVSAFGLFCAAAAALVLSFVTPVKAAGAERAFASDLIETGSVYAPRGFTELCERRPEFCAAEKAAAETDPVAETLAAMFGAEAAGFQPPVLTQARLETLARVNTAVNAAIRPVPDAGADRWELNAAQGDCEDYVLMKREMLARLGWPRSALRITVVRDAQGYHAVLVAETDQGGFVLDNMTQNLTRVSQNPYEFVVSQSIDTPGAWVRVHKR